MNWNLSQKKENGNVINNINFTKNIANINKLSHININAESAHGSKRKKKSRVSELAEKKEKLDKEKEELEKEYLSLIAKLLVMTQVHCEIKTDMYNEFDKLGLQTHVEEVEQSFKEN